MNEDIISCQNCNIKFAYMIDSCPNCNSKKKLIHLELDDILPDIFDTISGKKVNPNLNSKKKMLEKFYDGYDKSANGDLAYKKQTISPEKDYYLEEVKNSQENIIHYCEEQLSNHKNRGHAKFKNNN
ncbi:hypothetical protein [Flavobacterium sp. Arc2]|uniref:hypothetical protein n=1 Tax=Flavobacterium sp. Arc2 TaxID=3046685 RepID=UPI00352D3B45